MSVDWLHSLRERFSALLDAQSGLLTLTVDGREVERPELNQNGVFLGERKRDTRAVDSVRAVVYRLVADDVPTRLVICYPYTEDRETECYP